jgi:hypothetical protein
VPDSLTIQNQIELLGNGTYSTIPACAGAQFRLAPGYDLSAPQPTTDIVASLVLDGERPFGRRASNRQISLPIAITAPTRALLAGARETLLQAIDAQTWTLTWTRSGGLPLVLDCFRALPTVVTYELKYDRALWSLITISFQALPYGRSNLPVQLAVASPISGGSAVAAPPAPVVLDAFTSVTGTQWSQSAQHVIGPNSAYWDPGASPASNPTGAGIFPTKSGTFAAKNLTGLTAVSVWAGCGSSYIWNWELAGQPSTFSWTLTDNVGHTLTFGRTYTLQSSNAKLSPKWQLVTAPIPAVASSGVFNMAAVTGYSVSVSNHADWTGQQFTYANFYLDAITAQPPSTTSAASARGAIYQLYGILGTSHAPLTLQFQQKISAPPVTVVLSGSGTFLPPAGVSVASVLALGGGGAGATQTTAGLGGGGGGGECALEAAYPLTPGTPVAYACGMGGLSLDVAPSLVVFGTAGTVTWTCPAGVTSLTVACVGGSGGGAPSGSGGGGGEFAGQTVTTVPGTVYTITVGAGGVGGGYGVGGYWWYQNNKSYYTATPYNTPAGAGGISTFGPAGSPVVTAHGGGAAPSFSGTTALGGTGSSATTHHDGGAGAVGAVTYAAGGGSSGGSGSAGNPGTSTTMGTPVAGGTAGGGYSGWEIITGRTQANNGGPGADGQVTLSWVAATSVVNGGATTFGTSGTIVTAHGGTSAATNSATAGIAGTGSANTIHHDGGAGAAGASGTGGGGGASGGSAATGGAGTGAAGGIPGVGGTAGGAGAPSGDLAGSAGSPGAGGGGGDMASIPVDGGPGGAGQITLTYTPTLAPFKTLIAHRPGPDAPATLTPFVSTTSPADPPDGRQYPVPSLVAGVNARFGGTYSVVLVAYAWNAPTVPREVTVTVWQYEYPGGPSYPAAVSATLTPSGITNGIVTIGELTLPVRDIAPDNTTAYFAVGINSANLADQFLDVIFLDTLGSTLMVANNTESVNNLYVDAATVDRDIGRVMGSWYDRAEAVSILGSAFVSGGPLTVEGGQDAILLAYSLEGCPAVSITYTPRFFLDRTM